MKLARRMGELSHAGDTVSAVCHIVQRDGSTRFVNSINRLVAPTGEGDIIQKLVLDITEHVEIERALVKISYEDALTHLFNRSRFRRDLEGTVKILAHFPTAPRPAVRCGYSSSSVTSR
ncbi:hypothetical protein H6A18_05105 [Collinsella tanakaei]|uniref:hypothetical protein n=1 Tax=Collinsella tanakaei TaxID=626935 RepID=UPI00195BBA95|nr:hypothetical protein [Collinsella tanakaei]MBM6755892.1 hypothetical protein [Collinsella tanakaei]